MKAAAVVLAVVVALGVSAAGAAAGWSSGGNGAGAAAAKSMPAGNQPVATVSNRNVTVAWSQSSFQNGPAVSGYLVKRYDINGQSQNISSGCSGTVSGLTCTEAAVPAGEWRYSVTPKHASWTGAESLRSTSVTVQSPSLSFTSATTLTSLPTTLSGSISHFISGQTVSFRLDNPETGAALTGSISPSPVQTTGGASVSVTIPSGTANGSHAVYAIGSSGDVASAPITVNVPTCTSPGTQTVTANADSYVDQSSPTQNFGTSSDLFVLSKSGSANRRTFVRFNLPALPTGCAVTGATLTMYSTAAASGRTIVARRVTANWSETTINWSNMAATTTTGQATSASGTGTRSWSVASLVQAMYSGGNFGFALLDSVENASTSPEQKYQSREGTPDSQDPKLVVTWG